jgi:hypothetical protein
MYVYRSTPVVAVHDIKQKAIIISTLFCRYTIVLEKKTIIFFVARQVWTIVFLLKSFVVVGSSAPHPLSICLWYKSGHSNLLACLLPSLARLDGADAFNQNLSRWNISNVRPLPGKYVFLNKILIREEIFGDTTPEYCSHPSKKGGWIKMGKGLSGSKLRPQSSSWML